MIGRRRFGLWLAHVTVSGMAERLVSQQTVSFPPVTYGGFAPVLIAGVRMGIRRRAAFHGQNRQWEQEKAETQRNPGHGSGVKAWWTMAT